MGTSDRDQRQAVVDEVELFAGLDESARAALGGVVEEVELPGGQMLINQGDAADCLYVVISGRLSARVTGVDGTSRWVGEVGRGEVVGEMALFTEEPRTATVVAERDARLLRLPTEAFDSVVATHPRSLRAIAGQVVERLQRSGEGSTTTSPLRTVAVVPLQGSAAVDQVAGDVTAALLQLDPSGVAVAGEEADAAVGHLDPSDGRDRAAARWMGELEDDHQPVVYRCDAEPTWWTSLAVRQADLLIMVADARTGATPSDVERLCAERRRTLGTRCALVLAQAPSLADPRHTSRWLAGRDVDSHHHVRIGRAEDAARAARLLLGRSTALVLSGGGARGMAEIGVVRAMQELGIPIDAVAGTSAGALVGGAVARDWPADRISETVRAGVIGDGAPVDPTLPLVSLASGRRVTERIKAAAEGLDLEDLWLPYFCVSTNLSRKEPHVHRRGPAWLAIRASFAIPGVFPPVPLDDDVLVDGGMLDNLPVERMRSEHPGATVVGVDVGARRDLHASGLPESCVVSGWDALATRVAPWRREAETFSIMRILTRLTELGSGTNVAADPGDVAISPPVQHLPILDFTRFDDFVDAGYREGLRVLSEWLEAGPGDAG